jgi:alpha,alpha-trehalase
MLTLDNLKDESTSILSFIEQKWDDLIGNARSGHRDKLASWKDLAATSIDGHLDDIDPDTPYILFLPNDFIFPGGRFVVQFYWDSYFIILSLLRGNRFELAKGMVENCLFLVEQHGMIIANRKRWAAGSQLPFLSEMVKEVYQISGDKLWLEKALPVLEKEYKHYWLNQDHLAYRDLSRYHAPSCFPRDYIASITLDNEATWDLSPRFEVEDVLHLLPIDLNSNLCIYERNFAYFYEQLNQEEEARSWRESAQKRLKTINELMWDEQDGLYYDYNYRFSERKKVKSLATYFPLFYGLINVSQAERLHSNLCLFEKEFGLVTCDQDYGYSDRQWNYPIGWAPLHWIVYKGLKNYGYDENAKRIALKWLNLNYSIWEKTGNLFEKYDVVRGSHEVLTDRYKNQEGFGWTNAVFHALAVELAI